MMPRYAGQVEEEPRRHKIVDGDTLEALAKTYLDSAERAGEIFEANRKVLESPQVLPIGVELSIPPRFRPPPPPPKPIPKRPLVPVHP
jgi:nucleoid-associated protein YgaU